MEVLNSSVLFAKTQAKLNRKKNYAYLDFLVSYSSQIPLCPVDALTLPRPFLSKSLLLTLHSAPAFGATPAPKATTERAHP